mgnify:FL=1
MWQVYLKGQLSAIASSTSQLNYLLHVSDCLFDFRIRELRLGRREHQIMHALILKNKLVSLATLQVMRATYCLHALTLGEHFADFCKDTR